eukprot:TRINITY_DN13047_c0_g2_i1.p2 TRINITY_DN13047_c0_g2~~TRINITY_DN13047_c0_g2_i1.p2  ORF type:complete len:105 (-),score=0.25 TRINITY_DN13047_c0_g2_i1:187-501(-)
MPPRRHIFTHFLARICSAKKCLQFESYISIVLTCILYFLLEYVDHYLSGYLSFFEDVTSKLTSVLKISTTKFQGYRIIQMFKMGQQFTGSFFDIQLTTSKEYCL